MNLKNLLSIDKPENASKTVLALQTMLNTN